MWRRRTRRRRTDSDDDYMAQLLDWQDHMYVRGYYVGKFRPHRPISLNQPWRRIYVIVHVILALLPIFACLVAFMYSSKDITSWPSILVVTLVALFLLYVQLKQLKRVNRFRNNKPHK